MGPLTPTLTTKPALAKMLGVRPNQNLGRSHLTRLVLVEIGLEGAQGRPKIWVGAFPDPTAQKRIVSAFLFEGLVVFGAGEFLAQNLRVSPSADVSFCRKPGVQKHVPQPQLSNCWWRSGCSTLCDDFVHHQCPT